MEFRYSIQCVHTIASSLSAVLEQAVLTDAFVHTNQELYLNFKANGEPFSLHLNCVYRAAFFLFFDKETDRMSGVQPIFQALIGKDVIGVQYIENERVFTLEFENNQRLVFKCFGPLMNVLYFRGMHLDVLFRPQIKQDMLFNLQQMGHLLPCKPIAETVLYRVFELDQCYFLDIQLPEMAKLKLTTVDILEAYTSFAIFELKRLQFNEAKTQLLKSINSKIDRCKKIIYNNQTKIAHLNQAIPLDEIGHLIMSHMHLIKKGDNQVQVFDFYRNTDLKIALNTKLNAAENAAVYYRKSKNRKLELENANLLIEKSTKELVQLERALAQAEVTTVIKEIKKQSVPKQKESLFKEFMFDDYQIWVGRNSKNNDVLTFQHAHKEDLWLHAAGVSGSHVIIKRKGIASIPEPVIYRAAQLAAYFSKAKSSSMVLVMYTEKKYIRKFKSALAGQVKVEREKTILVEPKLA